MLIKLYDEVFAHNNNTITFEDFKKQNLRSGIIAAKVAQESFAVAQLERIITGKNFEEIEKLFQLYAVLKQEREMLGQNYVNDATADPEKLTSNQNL